MRWVRGHPLRRRVFVAVAVGAIALGFAGYASRIFDVLDLDTVDARFSIRGTQSAPQDLIVVAIDARTFQDLGQRFPFQRSTFARALDTIRRDRPRAVAYDVQFTERTGGEHPTQADVLQDNTLIESVAALRHRVALATTEIGPRGTTNIFGGDAVLRGIGARAGNSNFPRDRDGVTRHVSYSGQGLKTLALVTAEIAGGRPIRRADLGGDRAWIDFRGPPGTIRSVSFGRVADGRTPRGFFQGKIVVIGATAPVLQDIHTTAVSGSEPMAGPELHANAISTALRGFPLRDAAWWSNAALIVLLGAIAPLASLRLDAVRALVGALVAGLAYLVATQLVFDSGRVLSVVYPLATLAVSFVGTLLGHYLIDVVERERIRDTFARFVPEGVVDDVLAETGGGPRLGGVRREATALFADLRGFSTFSEGLEAEQVIDVVNHYLSEMSEAVLDHGGTLVAYMGDGLMAVFGAPLAQPDHADRAVAAAREMVNVRLAHLNAWLLSQGLDHVFRMGVGVNSGFVMSGNVGSQRRLEYAAIGDTVNVASRLEDMTKATPHQVLIAESTRERMLAAAPDLFYVDELPVRGRTAPIRVWSLRDVAATKPVGETSAPAHAAAEGRSHVRPAGPRPRDRRRPRRR